MTKNTAKNLPKPEVIRLGRQSFALWRDILGRLNTPVMMQEKGSLQNQYTAPTLPL